ncbi:cystathionine gamma-lyase [Aplysia californica]|uniref:cystathionine gamma-lyase n=1 Tax=Aplysia californica TaxID=6500 RepID=A0ABM1A395_APLCA|nr:cystathionine gamma-lyase [Aplysia californica]
MEEDSKPFEKQSEETLGLATLAIHSGQDADNWKSRALVTPIVTSNSFKHDVYAEGEEYHYSRMSNPTRKALETNLASLEGGKYGLVFGSGLGALSTVIYLLKSGDSIVVSEGYGGTHRYFRRCADQLGLKATFVDGTNVENFASAIQPNTRLVWMESPTNPLMKLIDIQAVCNRIRSITSDWTEKPIIVVDNTVMSSYFQRPLSLGVDIVMHSLSKYMNGHSDVIMGALILSNEEIYEKLKFFQMAVGVTSSPFDCYLVLRGLKTLHVRMREHEKNSLEVARFLEQHPCCVKVNHPGLPSHPQYELGRRQMDGYSGVLSFYIKGGLDDAKRFVSKLKLFAFAASLGGYESLCEIPMTFSQRHTPAGQRETTGITQSLVRLSVGLEDVKDLKRDIGQALDYMLSAQNSAEPVAGGQISVP